MVHDDSRWVMTVHDSSQHIFIYEWILSNTDRHTDGKIKLIYCPTEEMLANFLMKALPNLKVKHFAKALGLAQD